MFAGWRWAERTAVLSMKIDYNTSTRTCSNFAHRLRVRGSKRISLMTPHLLQSRARAYYEHEVVLLWRPHVPSGNAISVPASVGLRKQHTTRMKIRWKCGELKLYFSPSAGG